MCEVHATLLGLRAAIAISEADPKLKVALICKVYPMRSHTCAAEGGAAGVKGADDSLEMHFNDTVGRGDWLCDQDVVEDFVQRAPRELMQLEHWGCPWSREDDGSVAVRFTSLSSEVEAWLRGIIDAARGARVRP